MKKDVTAKLRDAFKDFPATNIGLAQQTKENIYCYEHASLQACQHTLISISARIPSAQSE